MIDVVTVGAGGGSIAWISPEGTLKVGPRSAGADPGPLCYGRGGTEPTVTDAHLVLGRIPPHLLGGEIPLDVDAARTGLRAARRHARARRSRPAPPASWRSRPGTRPTRCARSPSSAAWTSATSRWSTFGGSGSLLAVPADRHPRPARRAGAARPGQRLGLRPADRRRAQRLRADRGQPRTTRSTSTTVDATFDGAARAGRAGAGRARASRRTSIAFVRTADLRYFGQAFEVRVAVPDGPVDDALADAVAERLPRRARALYGYASAATRASRSSG